MGSDNNERLKRRRRRIFERDGDQCLRCGSPDNLTLDHIVPQSVGGCSKVWNLQTLCLICNQWKADRVEQFLFTNKTLAYTDWYDSGRPMSEFPDQPGKTRVKKTFPSEVPATFSLGDALRQALVK